MVMYRPVLCVYVSEIQVWVSLLGVLRSCLGLPLTVLVVWSTLQQDSFEAEENRLTYNAETKSG